jgi:hypothetical protein
MNTPADVIALRKATIDNYLARLADVVHAVPVTGEWSDAGDLARIESALGALLEAHAPRVTLDRDRMTAWYATRERRDSAREEALSGVDEVEGLEVNSIVGSLGYGLRIDGRTDEALDLAIEILSSLE